MSDLSATFGDWRDRTTYLLAEAQLLVAAVLVASGLVLWYFDPGIPVLPPWVGDLLVGWLVLAPPSTLAGLRFAHWLRTRNWVEVHHVNRVDDVVKTYFVPPEVWDAKRVDGPAPYRVNDGDAVAVREFDWAPEYGENGQLTVSGVFLSELEDVKLYTSRKHAERSYEELVDSHLSLAYLRDSISDLAASLQTRLINEMAYAREHGEHLDKAAVQEVTDEFREQAESVTEAEVTDLSPEDLPDWTADALPEGRPEDVGMETDAQSQPAATDGGTPR
ncbi:hypothetical protein [Halobacterium litoreum]|uniref:Uncharacterized protein n=1 Tax=Halobacterium litoreum TaxID=2039234 RepID=A0ABD5NHP5_9EURY|nr:hypothetical protein [Halobacterium litoreum]UHH12418.1 hypothetical protein LT972_09635 [Halobacterium litoreum]